MVAPSAIVERSSALFARPEKLWRVPTISMFYGILVSMYALDIEKHHAPHIHLRYNEFRIVPGIPDGEVRDGSLLSR